MEGFKHKRVIVTGAASGIGKATAEQFIQQGAQVGLIDLHADELSQIKESFSAQVYVETVDVTDSQGLLSAITKLADAMGGLDILHVNAGINGTFTPIEALTIDEWDQTINTNLRSTFLSVKAAVPVMKANGGSIVITSSVNGNRVFSNFGASAYSTSKAGQVAFAKMAALELSRYNIRVNVICPGAISTNIDDRTDVEPAVADIEIPVDYPEGARPLKQETGVPEQVANLVLFLSSEAAGNISGTEVYIDGAESLL
ncbi:SDR family NAD(P)-dependent oxidoreductase [Enterococcus sp.]|uniref:SDR family oxidoreductase n=1 Tax=Enterococcus sp. TaxID=35783 RepID=UPI00289D2124|nr:SDR family NAD(P)-dependent oxidoreductase [Enterococcus sp.]